MILNFVVFMLLNTSQGLLRHFLSRIHNTWSTVYKYTAL